MLLYYFHCFAAVISINYLMVGIVLLILALFYSVIISVVFGFVLTVAIMGFAKIGSVKEGLAFFKRIRHNSLV